MNNTERKDYRLVLHEQMKKIYRRRIIVDRPATIFAIVCVVAAIIPLGSILLEVVKNGVAALSLEFLVAT
ncbi:MAG: phosphate ABC transporter, permease protein PstA, partial [Nitrososphaeraceae archaeon]